MLMKKIKRSLINLNTLKMFVHPKINDTPYVVIGVVLFMKRLQLKRHSRIRRVRPHPTNGREPITCVMPQTLNLLIFCSIFLREFFKQLL